MPLDVVAGCGHRSVVVAPEVAAGIVTRRAAGESVADIGRDLHMTPLEVRDVLRANTQTTGGKRCSGRR